MNSKVLITAGILLLVVVAGFFLFLNKNEGVIEDEVSRDTIESYFIEQIRERAIENNGGLIPIEGFDPQLYMGAYPGLEESDFKDAEAISGKWSYENGALEFERGPEGEITSADGTITDEGLRVVLQNLEQRLQIEADSKANVDLILDEIEKE